MSEVNLRERIKFLTNKIQLLESENAALSYYIERMEDTSLSQKKRILELSRELRKRRISG